MSSAEAAAVMTAPAPRRVRVPGADLFTTTVGRGRPLLVMHGLGFDHTYMRPWLDGLRGVAAVTYYDHRGNGRSTADDPAELLTHAAFVRDADAVREQLGAEQIVVFGHSYGGYLALEYALAHRDRVAALILCATGPCFDYGQVALANARARGTARQVAAVERALSGPLATDADWAALFRTITPLYFRDASVLRSVDPFASVQYRAGAFNGAFHRCIADFDARPRLAEIRVPTLILAGVDDWIQPLEYTADRLAAGIAGSEMVVFPESGHMPFVEEPEPFLRTVRDWIARLP